VEYTIAIDYVCHYRFSSIAFFVVDMCGNGTVQVFLVKLWPPFFFSLRGVLWSPAGIALSR
jgi:hypothetical protein